MVAYVSFAFICAIICLLSILVVKIKYDRQRKRILRKVTEAKLLLRLIDSCIEFIEIEPKIDQSSFPIIYKYCQRNVGAILGVSQELNNGFNSIRISAKAFDINMYREIRNCPDNVKEFLGKQSDILTELHKTLHPVKSWLYSARKKLLLCGATIACLVLSAMLTILKATDMVATMNRRKTELSETEDVVRHKPVLLKNA